MSLRALVILCAVALTACTKRDPDPAPPAPIATTPPPDPLAACRGCEKRDADVPWFFIGNYLDSKCTQPVLHATFEACQAVKIPSTVSQQLGSPLGARKIGDNVEFRVSRQLTTDEVERVFKKEDGKCSPQGAHFKIAPLGCDGKRVCKDEGGELSCGLCATLPNQCPNFQGSRVYALADVLK